MIADGVRKRSGLMTMGCCPAGRHRGEHQVTEVQTVTAAVVLMGIGPFFRAFPPAGLRVLEEELRTGADPQRLDRGDAPARRAWRTAQVVTEFELQHGDPHAEAMQGAAVMHNLAEVLLWWRAPEAARRLGRDPDGTASASCSAARWSSCSRPR